MWYAFFIVLDHWACLTFFQLTWRVAQRIWAYEEPAKTVRDVISEPVDHYHHLVIVDEAQNLYSSSVSEVAACSAWADAPYPLFLWARIKEISNIQTNSKVKFLVLAAYGTVRLCLRPD